MRRLPNSGCARTKRTRATTTIHQALLTGLLGNIGFKSDDAKARRQAGRGQLPGRARHQAVDPSRLGAGEKRPEVDHGGRADRHRAAARAHRRRGAAGMDRGGRAASADAHVHRAALGEGGRARGGVRARQPVRHHPGAAAQDSLRQHRSRAVARAVHPRRAGGGRIRHAGEVAAAQPQRWFRKSRTSNTRRASRACGWTRSASSACSTRASRPASTTARRSRNGGRSRSHESENPVPAARGHPRRRPGRRPRAVPRDHAGRRRGVQAEISFRTRPCARRRDAAVAAVSAQPHRGGAGRLAGARPHPRKAHRIAETAAERQAPSADPAARYGDGISGVAQAGRADLDRRAGGLHPQENRRRHPS